MISIALISVTLASIMSAKLGIAISIFLAIWVDHLAFRKRGQKKRLDVGSAS
ncbi:hypothetical protein [Azospirillum sp. TSO5]|uniref:hypothetical protein n=1 Tax=Azospirillum sp. TSO5 TaxID=716760 RepID=UPI0013050073|nr:hypothetical protein [Azospirillum sp. TSO5]